MAPSSSPPLQVIKDESKQTFENDAISISAKNIGTLPSVKTLPNLEKLLEETAGPIGEAEPQYATGIKLYLVVASVSLAIFLMLLDISIIATVSQPLLISEKLLIVQAIPLITDEFQSLQDVGWYGSAYLLARYGLHLHVPIWTNKLTAP